jgi:hypothetical protein
MIKALDGVQNYVTRMDSLGGQKTTSNIVAESNAVFAFYREATNFLEMCREEHAKMLDSDSKFKDVTSIYIDTLNYYKRVVRGIAYRYSHMISISSIAYAEDGIHININKVRLVKKLDDWLRSLDLFYRYSTSCIKELNLISSPPHIEDDINSAIDILHSTDGPEGVIHFITFYLEELRDTFKLLEKRRIENNGEG